MEIKTLFQHEMEINSLLISSQNYRRFLGNVFDLLKKKNKNFSYAEFSRRAGFSSRSYPRDVVLGKKRITATSIYRFSNALGLKGDARSFFILLVGREESEVLQESIEVRLIDEKLKKIASRISAKYNKKQDSNSFYQFQNWLCVYASLGTIENGASVDEIKRRTGLRDEECEKALQEMLNEKAIFYNVEKNRYYANDLHLIFSHIKADSFFHKVFLESALQLNKSAQVHFDHDDHLFFHSVFSVNKKSLPKFKEDLRQLLLQYVDTSEDPNGDGIAKLTVGLIPQGSSEFEIHHRKTK